MRLAALIVMLALPGCCKRDGVALMFDPQSKCLCKGET
jgi:hypothetical protein